jgi:hypothetical protein
LKQLLPCHRSIRSNCTPVPYHTQHCIHIYVRTPELSLGQNSGQNAAFLCFYYVKTTPEFVASAWAYTCPVPLRGPKGPLFLRSKNTVSKDTVVTFVTTVSPCPKGNEFFEERFH